MTVKHSVSTKLPTGLMYIIPKPKKATAEETG